MSKPMEVWNNEIKTDFGQHIHEALIEGILSNNAENIVAKAIKLKEITDN